MTTKNGKTVYLQAVTMIDPTTGWIEIRTVPSAQANLVSNQIEVAWLTRYQLPSKVIVDRGNEFEATIIQANYRIEVKSITSRNPQVNSILDRVHQTIGNIIHIFKVQDMVLDDKKTWDRILASTMFTLRTTVCTTTQHTPV